MCLRLHEPHLVPDCLPELFRGGVAHGVGFVFARRHVATLLRASPLGVAVLDACDARRDARRDAWRDAWRDARRWRASLRLERAVLLEGELRLRRLLLVELLRVALALGGEPSPFLEAGQPVGRCRRRLIRFIAGPDYPVELQLGPGKSVVVEPQLALRRARPLLGCTPCPVSLRESLVQGGRLPGQLRNRLLGSFLGRDPLVASVLGVVAGRGEYPLHLFEFADLELELNMHGLHRRARLFLVTDGEFEELCRPVALALDLLHLALSFGQPLLRLLAFHFRLLPRSFGVHQLRVKLADLRDQFGLLALDHLKLSVRLVCLFACLAHVDGCLAYERLASATFLEPGLYEDRA